MRRNFVLSATIIMAAFCGFFSFFSKTDLGFTEIVPGGVVDGSRNILYIPQGIDSENKYPLVIAFSPDADAQSMIKIWRSVADEHKWIILASKEFRNGKDMRPIFKNLVSALGFVFQNYPVDKSKIIVSGFSGGGMGAHAFSFWYPELTTAIVVNTGMMHEDFVGHEKEYPKGKIAVFLASPSDFRYDEMKKDKDFLDRLDWDTKWIEFKGGHQIAPVSAYKGAAEWLMGRLE